MRRGFKVFSKMPFGDPWIVIGNEKLFYGKILDKEEIEVAFKRILKINLNSFR